MLYWDTVNNSLKLCLQKLMQAKELTPFRLVGGTALSLFLGHRISVDIDLFTDAEYGSVDFEAIEKMLKKIFKYVEGDFGAHAAMGKSYLIGDEKDELIKLDIYYTNDPYFQEMVVIDGIKLASLEEIIAMKVDVIQRGGRKKDFWDLHELLEKYPISKMIELHKKRYEWTHDPQLILKQFTNFSNADDDFEPICNRGKLWVFIKEDFEDAVSDF